MIEGERTYTTKSGITCRYRVEEKGDNVAIAVRLLADEVSDAEKEELMHHIYRELAAEGIELDDLFAAEHGEGRAGRARTTEAVRRFLKTGDPGVPTKTFDPTKI